VDVYFDKLNNVTNPTMSEPAIFMMLFIGFAFAPSFLEWLGMPK